jgi:hypothetical protein
MLRRLAISLSLVFGLLNTSYLYAEPPVDVVVYGGNAGGVAAAVQVRRMGKRVLLIEPTQHLGGLTSGGLGATDIGRKGAIGGVSREFYQRVKKHYENDTAWTAETRADYRGDRNSPADDAMWTFEPHVAENILREMMEEAGVELVLGERLDLTHGVKKEGNRITQLQMESGKTFAAHRYIDATYEGDLMALAGVRYAVGREANATYREELNGVQTHNATHHQLEPGIDPYVKKGDPKSGLLPGIDPAGPGKEGAGDNRLQAYNFRMCVTDAPQNRIPFAKPAGYDELEYELLFRNFEAGEKRAPWHPVMMPNRKTDANNNHGFSTDYIGMNYNWADANYAARERLYEKHLTYQQGLMWTLANHPRVPEHIRDEMQRWGNCRDEFIDNGGWSPQLYVREARRMISDYVMTQHNCQGREKAADSVGLAAYTMDSHHVQRYIDSNGHVRNEGDVQVGGFLPYPISYRSIVPKQQECSNLLVPVCLAASHIAYGSIRMEPVFMVLGQSSATAAVQSLENDEDVQRIDVAKLQERLRADEQVLEWTGTPVESIDPRKLPGIVVDDVVAKKEGNWTSSNSIAGFVGLSYLHDGAEGRGKKQVTFLVPIAKPGTYEVRIAYTATSNRATNVPVTIKYVGGEATKKVNQRNAPAIDNTFASLGVFEFNKEAVVVISNEGTDGHVIVDAVQLLAK